MTGLFGVASSGFGVRLALLDVARASGQAAAQFGEEIGRCRDHIDARLQCHEVVSNDSELVPGRMVADPRQFSGHAVTCGDGYREQLLRSRKCQRSACW